MTSNTWTGRPDASLPVAIEVLRHGPISRTAIAKRLNLSAGSLTRLSTPLLAEGLIRDVGEHNDGRVGRPRQLLDVDPGSRHFVGLKLRENEIIGALTNLRGEILDTSTVAIVDRSPKAVVELVAQVVSQLAGDASLSGIGIGIGGVVRNRAYIVNSPYLEWSELDLGALVTERTGIPTLVDNDVIAFTEYEHWFGEGRNDDRFAVVSLGVGTGFGLVVNGTQVTSDDYGIGLVNHWPLDPTGPICPAGHRGCVKSVLNSDAIARRVSDALDRPVHYEEALDLAAEGQPAAVRIVEEAGRGLGRLLAAICNLTLPDRIIIAGEGVRLAAVARAAVDAGIAADRDPLAATPPLVLASGDNVEWCRGAAVLAIQAFVRGPAATPR